MFDAEMFRKMEEEAGLAGTPASLLYHATESLEHPAAALMPYPEEERNLEEEQENREALREARDLVNRAHDLVEDVFLGTEEGGRKEDMLEMLDNELKSVALGIAELVVDY